VKDFKRGPISELGAGLARAAVARFPVDLAVYDTHVAPLVNEALGRLLPNEPLSLVEMADRIGILPAKPRGRRNGLR
jgi:hypothetical protein